MPDFVHFVIADSSGPVLVQGLALFVLAGVGMILAPLLFARLIRPDLPHPEKLMPYECGEPVFGTARVQFDLRFYVVALVFLIFDIEIALFYPWAVVYGSGTQQVRFAATWDMLFFFGVIVVGFLYLWRFGYLNWVRAGGVPSTGLSIAPPPPPPAEIVGEQK
jgi:NADH-quinone oxidoreductase subunit A